ncbi:hypothetical protein EUGRSUZ_K01398 [Eucalyptus grandis]|uniref:Uncharacterized protein n=2 Tax=Eucalyptus grandis TaxID=71139 RepID=A0ACC3IUR8_EUCGR|nr:hypothetical protein EUGRSUZ_K01398 [Eucalyptus grandis]
MADNANLIVLIYKWEHQWREFKKKITLSYLRCASKLSFSCSLTIKNLFVLSIRSPRYTHIKCGSISHPLIS